MNWFVLGICILLFFHCGEKNVSKKETDVIEKKDPLLNLDLENIAFTYSETGEKPENYQLFVSARKGLMLRSEPTNSAPVLLTIPYGEKLGLSSSDPGVEDQVGESYGAWKKTSFKGKSGYVFDAFLSAVNQKYIDENFLKHLQCDTYTNLPTDGLPTYEYYLLKNGIFVLLIQGEIEQIEVGAYEETKEEMHFHTKANKFTLIKFLGKWMDEETRVKYRKEPRILDRFQKELNDYQGQPSEHLFICEIKKKSS